MLPASNLDMPIPILEAVEKPEPRLVGFDLVTGPREEPALRSQKQEQGA